MRQPCLALAATLAASAAVVAAQSGGEFSIRRSTIDTGGGYSTGGAYALTGTIGQPDPGQAGSGTYTVHGGFWASPLSTGDLIFANGFEP
ncbi:hypothetical protein [Dokdonella sp.]|uniref:hypothetical protein n=1 Tax=Dokdonella sp. TaxID=2291710 RepID=UPI0025BD4585|nr:hypothetical protein [Dokdonella sp.]MBX3690978.1 hypothetical protein [Dokdonella sp.]MCW5567465.1 hypothetical protein [Dokdonella sp.]